MIGIFVLAVVEIIAQQWIGIPLSPFLSETFWCRILSRGKSLAITSLLQKAPLAAATQHFNGVFSVPPIQRKFGRKGVIRLTAYTIAIASAIALFLDVICVWSLVKHPE